MKFHHMAMLYAIYFDTFRVKILQKYSTLFYLFFLAMDVALKRQMFKSKLLVNV